MSNYRKTGYYSQPANEELKKKSEATKNGRRKRGILWNPSLSRVEKIAKKWWGLAWCENLERYADYESRIERGKRYVRNGSVVDLKIEKGKISARVQGTRKTPYKTEINISPLSEERIQNIIDKCGKRIENIEELTLGNIPEELKDMFLEEGMMFPTPKEISFNCSCPDWAIMCKHVAAALYGVGVRLDERPLLFFELRGIDPNRFIDITLTNKVEEMLANKDNPSGRIMDGADIGALFGV